MKGDLISDHKIQDLNIENNIEYLSNQDMWSGGSHADCLTDPSIPSILFHCKEILSSINHPAREGRVGSFQIIIAWLRAVWLFVGPGWPWTHAMMTVMNKTDPEKVRGSNTNTTFSQWSDTDWPDHLGKWVTCSNVINSNKVNSNLSNFEPKYKVDHCLLTEAINKSQQIFCSPGIGWYNYRVHWCWYKWKILFIQSFVAIYNGDDGDRMEIGGWWWWR